MDANTPMTLAAARYPSPAAEAEATGSTVVYFAPAQPDGVAPGIWIQTDLRRAGSSSCACTARFSPFSTTGKGGTSYR